MLAHFADAHEAEPFVQAAAVAWWRAAARCSSRGRRAVRSSGDGRCAGPGRPARRRSSPSVACCGAPAASAGPSPTTWPSRSATRPSPWRNASSQSARGAASAVLPSARARQRGRPRASRRRPMPSDTDASFAANHLLSPVRSLRASMLIAIARRRQPRSGLLRAIRQLATVPSRALAPIRCVREAPQPHQMLQARRLGISRHAHDGVASQCLRSRSRLQRMMHRTFRPAALHGMPSPRRETAASSRASPSIRDNARLHARDAMTPLSQAPLNHSDPTMNFRPKYITFDCYGTLTRFRMGDVAREMFADRIPAERMEQFIADFSAYRFDEVLGDWQPYETVLEELRATAVQEVEAAVPGRRGAAVLRRGADLGPARRRAGRPGEGRARRFRW